MISSIVMDSLFADRFKDLSYPVKAQYCGECGLPTEYCSYYPSYEKCKAWIEKNLPEEFERLCGVSADAGGEGEDKTGGDGKMEFLMRISTHELVLQRPKSQVVKREVVKGWLRVRRRPKSKDM